MHCVDLGESFPTSIYLQKSASIQPRTSPSKFGGKFNSVFTSLLSLRRRGGTAGARVGSEQRGAGRDIATPSSTGCWSRRDRTPRTRRSFFGKFSAKCRSFSAVSAPIFASKYAFCSIFQNLSDYLCENFAIWQNVVNLARFAECLLNVNEFC